MRHTKTVRTALLFAALCLFLTACIAQPSVVPVIKDEVSQHMEISEPFTDEKLDEKELISRQLDLNSRSFEMLFSELDIQEPETFFNWIEEHYGLTALSDLAASAAKEDITAATLRELTGYGFHAFRDLYGGRLDKGSPDYMSNIIDLGFTESGTITMGFVGDVSFADNWRIMPKYDARGQGVFGILDEQMVEIMRSVDIMVANNEFVLSDRGSPIPGKSYTFRGTPSRVNIWHEMGVDLVSLANNHIYDFGEEAFFDTMDTLDKAGIARFGGGKDIEEASRPVYYIVNGVKIAFLAANRSEKNVFTPGATENSSGVMRTYDSTLLCAAIEKAKSQSDYVIVYVHWGTEHSTVIEKAQFTMGREYIDSGADLVIGHHAHILQGFDSYKGKIIAYNLGNYIFSATSVPTGILVTTITSDGEMESEFIPGYQQNCFTRKSEGAERDNIIKHLRSISFAVDISGAGIITPKD